MENFRLSHFSVIVLKAMINQRLFFKKKIVEFYLHCLCLQNWGQWAVQGAPCKYSHICCGNNTNLTSNLIGMKGKEL